MSTETERQTNRLTAHAPHGTKIHKYIHTYIKTSALHLFGSLSLSASVLSCPVLFVFHMCLCTFVTFLLLAAFSSRFVLFCCVFSLRFLLCFGFSAMFFLSAATWGCKRTQVDADSWESARVNMRCQLSRKQPAILLVRADRFDSTFQPFRSLARKKIQWNILWLGERRSMCDYFSV